MYVRCVGKQYEHVFWIQEQAQKTEQIRNVLIINLLVNLDWKKNDGFHYTSELGFSEFMIFYITRKLEFQVAKLEEPRVIKKSVNTAQCLPLHILFSALAFSTFICGYELTMLTITIHLAFPTYKWNIVNWYVTSFPAPTSDFWGQGTQHEYIVQRSPKNPTIFTNTYNELIQSIDNEASYQRKESSARGQKGRRTLEEDTENWEEPSKMIWNRCKW